MTQFAKEHLEFIIEKPPEKISIQRFLGISILLSLVLQNRSEHQTS